MTAEWHVWMVWLLVWMQFYSLWSDYFTLVGENKLRQRYCSKPDGRHDVESLYGESVRDWNCCNSLMWLVIPAVPQQLCLNISAWQLHGIINVLRKIPPVVEKGVYNTMKTHMISKSTFTTVSLCIYDAKLVMSAWSHDCNFQCVWKVTHGQV